MIDVDVDTFSKPTFPEGDNVNDIETEALPDERDKLIDQEGLKDYETVLDETLPGEDDPIGGLHLPRILAQRVTEVSDTIVFGAGEYAPNESSMLLIPQHRDRLRVTIQAGTVESKVTPQTVVADNVATDSLGIKLTYTPPAGETARVTGVSWFNNAGTPTVQLQLIRGGTTIVLRQDAASYSSDLDITLEDGDTLQFNVTVAGAALSTADAAFFLEETNVGGGEPTPYIGRGPDVSPSNGWGLLSATPIVFKTRAAIWLATGPGTGTVTVQWAIELVEES